MERDMSQDDADGKAGLAQRFIDALPHACDLGMKVLSVGAGTAVMALDYDPMLVGDPDTGVLHGGVVTALLDTCCGAAVMSHPVAPAGTATIDLRIDYMRPAAPGARLHARAECYRVTRTVAFTRAYAYTDDEAEPVAAADGAFTVEGR